MITFSCEHCGRKFAVGDELAGRQGTCKSCGKAIGVPELGREETRVLKVSAPEERHGTRGTAEKEEQVYALQAASDSDKPVTALAPPVPGGDEADESAVRIDSQGDSQLLRLLPGAMAFPFRGAGPAILIVLTIVLLALSFAGRELAREAAKTAAAFGGDPGQAARDFRNLPLSHQ